jgi:type IV pilus assembly protein PilM
LWAAPISKVKAMEDHRNVHKQQDDELVSKLTYLNVMGEKISGNAEGRVKWMEIIKTINAGIPRFDYPDGKVPTPKEGLPYEERKDIHVTQLDSKYYEDLSTWFTDEVEERYRQELRNWVRLTENEMPEDETGPTGPGWVFELHCYHYYNSPKNKGLESSNHIRKYMTTNFRKGSIKLPIGKDPAGNDIYDTFTFKEMGLSYPLLLDDTDPQMTTVPNPDYDPAAMATGGAGFSAAATTPDEGDNPAFEPPTLQVQRQDFVYQIVWQETLISERLMARENLEAAEGEGQQAATTDTAATPATP